MVRRAIVAGSALGAYQASGSAPMTRSGMSGWAKKNQCHQCTAKVASQRRRCSEIGRQSSSATCSTVSG